MTLKICHVDWRGAGAVGDDLLSIVLEKGIKRVANFLGVDVSVENYQGSNIEYLNKQDLIICGGGSAIPSKLPFYDEILHWSPNVFTPTAIIGTGVRMSSPEILQPSAILKIQELFQRCHVHGVRGNLSQYKLSEFGVDTTVCADTIFLADEEMFNPIPNSELNSEKRNNIGLVIRNVHPAEMKPEYAKNPDEFNQKMWNFFGHLTNSMTRDISETNVVFIPFRYTSDSIIDNDAYACGQVRRKMLRPERAKNAFVTEYNALEIAKLLSNQNNYFNISQRLHPIILSWMQGVPAIGIQHQFDKVADVCSTLDMKLFIDFKDIENETIVEDVDKGTKEKIINYKNVEEDIYIIWEEREKLLKRFQEKWKYWRLIQEDILEEAILHAVEKQKS